MVTDITASSIQTIYSYFGIDSAAIANLPTTALAGSVSSSGAVYVGKALVADNAMTVERADITGSKQISIGGTTFYTDPMALALTSGSAQAYVVISGGQFSFAITARDGNPVSATPVTAATAKAAAAVDPLAPAPSASCNTLQVENTSNGSPQVSGLLSYNAKHGASLSGVTYDWGDGYTSAAGTAVNVKHTYAKNGTYTVRAVLIFTAPKIIPNAVCRATVKVTGVNEPAASAQKATTNTTGSSATTGTTGSEESSNANNGSSSTATGGSSQTPASEGTDSSSSTPLANTGPGNVVGLFVVAALVGMAVCRRLIVRRLS